MISFIGAGPGAADLITIRGAERLARADVVIWASSLVPAEMLDHCRHDVVIHDSATMTLEDVLAVYRDGHATSATATATEAEAGTSSGDTAIVRLHSGDPALYGAVQEQIDWCRTADIDHEIVPGVSAVAGAAASLGQELTAPGRGQAVVMTRLAGRTRASMRPDEDVRSLASHGTTMAVFLSGARPDELQAELSAEGSGYRADTPAAVIVRATWPDEQVVRTTVGELASAIRSTGATMTVLVLVGDVLGAPDRPVDRSHLYSPAFTTAYRLRSTPGTTAGRPSRRAVNRAEHPGR